MQVKIKIRKTKNTGFFTVFPRNTKLFLKNSARQKRDFFMQTPLRFLFPQKALSYAKAARMIVEIRP